MPDWLGKIVLALTFILAAASLISGALLAHSIESPYKLTHASSAQRWVGAAIVAACYWLLPATILFGGTALLSPSIHPSTLLLVAVLVVPFYAILVLTIRLRLSMIDSMHQSYDQSLRHPFRSRIARHPFFAWLYKLLIPSWDRDRRRFFERGFDETDGPHRR